MVGTYQTVTYTTAAEASASGALWDLTGPGPAVLDGIDLRGWSWSYDDDTNVASRRPREYTVTVAFMGDRDGTAGAAANRFLSLAERDVARGMEGTLDVGGWQLSCSVAGGSCEYAGEDAVVWKLTLRASEPVWRRVTRHRLAVTDGDALGTDWLDLPVDLPVDLGGSMVASSATQFAVDVDCSVRCLFAGPCTNPYVRLTSVDATGATTTNLYGVNARAAEGELLVIDPLGKRTIGGSVYLRGTYGARTNEFANRVRGIEGSGSYVFATMPAGTITATWPQGVTVDVDTIEERMALPWIL